MSFTLRYTAQTSDFAEYDRAVWHLVCTTSTVIPPRTQSKTHHAVGSTGASEKEQEQTICKLCVLYKHEAGCWKIA